MRVENPILPGFNADPNALRVGSKYYIVTSTFNWFPGVSLYCSQDLVSWEHVGNILDRTEQLDLRGNDESCGIWAPQISYNDRTKKFYLVYTNVRSLSGSFFDLNNYIVEAENIEGPWSDPVYLNSSGFDPSLFHDDDGKSYLLNLAWEFRQGYSHPGPIICQEFDLSTMTLKGDVLRILEVNPKWGCTEGPHLYKRRESYYLLTAEGGTGYGHAVMIYRSKTINGNFVQDPLGPLLTSRNNPFPLEDDLDSDFLKERFYNPSLRLQKSGHGSLVETPEGETLLFHLCARPILPQMRCFLNRETAVQRVIWRENWPILDSEEKKPWPMDFLEVPSPFGLESSIDLLLENQSGPPKVSCNHETEKHVNDRFEVSGVVKSGVQVFDASRPWPVEWYSLKCPRDSSWCSLKKSPKGPLKRPDSSLPEEVDHGVFIRGRNSPYSSHDLSLIARRIQHFNCSFETSLQFDDPGYRQMAGMILLTGSKTFYYLRKYFSESLGMCVLGITESLNGELKEYKSSRTPIPSKGPIVLRCEISQPYIQFLWTTKCEVSLNLYTSEGEGQRKWSAYYNKYMNFYPVGSQLDATVLSDEFTNNGPGAFDGTFTGLTVQDLNNQSKIAYFSYFSYLNEKEV